MKPLLSLLACLFVASVAQADTSFPGLKKVLSDAEWKRAGLDLLTPDQIGVIDAAMIRQQVQATRAAVVAATTPPEPDPAMSPAVNAAKRASFWERFGIGKSKSPDSWRNQPPMVAKVTAWQGANRFVLDTGQVWEGVETIPYEILGQTVTIEARPLDSFALKLNANSVAVRVRRVK